MTTTGLGRTGLRVSRICLGTMTFGSQVDEGEARRMLDLSSDQGVNFLDTANVYNAGRSEQILGRLLQGRRSQFVLASKVRNAVGDVEGLSANAIERACESSLKRLQTDYLDIYYMHAPDYKVPLEESLTAMDRLVRSGKVRHIGSSNYASWQLTRMLWLSAAKALAAPMITQPMYNVLARGIEQEFLPACKEFGAGTVVYNPLAGGLLTGKQKPEAPIAGTRFDGNKMYQERYWKNQNFAAVKKLKAAAESNGRELIDVALNWLLNHTAIDCVIMGASRLDQLQQNLSVLSKGPLPEAVLPVCDEVWAELRGPSPKYNR